MPPENSEHKVSRVLSNISSVLEQKLFCKDATEVLKHQVINKPSCKLLPKPIRSSVYTHPINAEIGLEAVPAQNIIKNYSDRTIFWKFKHRDSVKSAIGYLHLFRKTSHVSMSAGSLISYPFHITLFNFKEDIGRSQTLSKMNICTYLSVRFDVENCSLLQSSSQNHDPIEKHRIQSRVLTLQTLHQSINFRLENVEEATLKGLPCRTLDNEGVFFHLILTLYITDIPKCEDFLSIKRVTRSISSCHDCLIKKQNLAINRTARQSYMRLCESPFLRIQAGFSIAEQKVHEFSMPPTPPVLHHFPFFGVCESVEIYTTFLFKPFHCLSLGLSKILEECLYRDLSYLKKRFTAHTYASRVVKPFSVILMRGLNCLNKFLCGTEHHTPRIRMRNDFSKVASGRRLTRLFPEICVSGMLELGD